MGLELRQIDDDVSLDYLSCNEILMTAGRVRICQQPRVIASDSERLLFIGDRLQEALASKIEEHEAVFIDNVLRCHSHTIHKLARRPSKVLNPPKPRLFSHQAARPLVKTGKAKKFIELAALDWRIAHLDF